MIHFLLHHFKFWFSWRLIFSLTLLGAFLSGCSGNPVGQGQFDFLFIPVAILTLVIVGALLLIIPVELILLLGVLSGVLAPALVAEEGAFYYLRFLPNIIISARVFLYIATSQAGRILLPTAIIIPFGLLSLFALFSTIYSSSPNLTAQRAISMLLGIIVSAIAIPAYLCRQPKRLQRLVLWIGLIMAIAALVGVLNPLISGNFSQRLSGIFVNPNTLGMVAMIAFFPLLAYWPKSGGLSRFVMTGILFLLIIVILLSGSRASLLGLAIGVLCLIVLSVFNNKSQRYAFLLIFVISILVVFLYFNFDLLTFSLGRTDDSGRLDILRHYIAYGLESPIWGHGFNKIKAVSQNALIYGNYLLSGNPFNSYILVFTGLGFIGLSLTIAGFGWIIQKSIRTLSQLENPWFFLALLSGVIASMIHAFFESWLFSFGNAPTMPFWIILSVLTLYAQHPNLYSNLVQLDDSGTAAKLGLASEL